MIAHGAFAHLAAPAPDAAAAPLPAAGERPVVLCFGLMRPYKGIDLLLEAWAGIEGAELWIAGMPRMDIAPLRAAAPPGVRFVPRFIGDGELPAYFRRADLVVLPYREIDQSGVLFTALAFGKPLLLSDVGGFPEVAATGAARTFPAGDARALGAALRELLARPATRSPGWRPRPARPRPGPTPGRPSPRARWSCMRSCSASGVGREARPRDRLLGVVRADRVDAARLRGGARAAGAPARAATGAPPAPADPPTASLIVAAHDEEQVIAAKVANALALDYPRERLQLIVACDGCSDATAARAREAGADLVLELPRGGKIRAQDAAVERARGEIVAFSDANALWEPGAARALAGAFGDPRVGYACGQVRFVRAAGAAAPNQEGVYWRYELAVRALESRLSSITAGNGAIYATRRELLHRGRPDHGPRPLAALQHGQARPARGV